jgi:hypothetical protein
MFPGDMPVVPGLPALPFPPDPSAHPGKAGQGLRCYPGLPVQPLHFPLSILGPTIIMMATIGAFAAKNTAIDVILMAISGLFGFVFVVCKLNSSTLILGLVRGTICESNLRRAILWSDLRETKPCSR